MSIGTYPLHEKYDHISDFTHAMGTFLEWLEKQKGLRLCAAYKPQYEWYAPICTSKEELLLEFFGISLEELENERWLMVKEQKNTPVPAHAAMN